MTSDNKKETGSTQRMYIIFIPKAVLFDIIIKKTYGVMQRKTRSKIKQKEEIIVEERLLLGSEQQTL